MRVRKLWLNFHVFLLFHAADRLDDSDFTYIINHPKSGKLLLKTLLLKCCYIHLSWLSYYNFVLHFVEQSNLPYLTFLPTLLLFHCIIMYNKHCKNVEHFQYILETLQKCENLSRIFWNLSNLPIFLLEMFQPFCKPMYNQQF